jgi:hypothetical protein
VKPDYIRIVGRLPPSRAAGFKCNWRERVFRRTLYSELASRFVEGGEWVHNRAEFCGAVWVDFRDSSNDSSGPDDGVDEPGDGARIDSRRDFIVATCWVRTYAKSVLFGTHCIRQ